jgi:TonB family protein
MLEQLERHETQEQLAVPRLEIAPAPAPVVENDQRQRRRMVIALVLLLVALGMVLVKDRDFWFPVSDVTESEAVDESTDNTEPAPVATVDTPAVQPAAPVAHKRGRAVAVAPKAIAPKAVAPEVASGPVVTTSRAVLPPLRVEVVAGDRRQLVRPGSPSVRVDLEPAEPAADSGAQLANAAAPLTTAGDRVQMSADTRQALTHPVRPEYPLLARQMKVQGAVGLVATIGKDGGIQTLKVTSGPAILADAAREAVKQWRFKPYLQDGQPVETEANITVGFTIRAN